MESEKTLEQFLREHRALKTETGYKFLYNGFQCRATVSKSLLQEVLTITPTNNTIDLGWGAGRSIFKFFNNPQNT